MLGFKADANIILHTNIDNVSMQFIVSTDRHIVSHRRILDTSKGTAIIEGSAVTTAGGTEEPRTYRVLCIDGGGMRGMVLTS